MKYDVVCAKKSATVCLFGTHPVSRAWLSRGWFTGLLYSMDFNVNAVLTVM